MANSKYKTTDYTIDTSEFDLSKTIRVQKDAMASFNETFNEITELLSANDSSSQKITNDGQCPQTLYNEIQAAINNKITEMTEIYQSLKTELHEVCDLMNDTFQIDDASTSFELNMKNVANKFSQNDLTLESCDMEQMFNDLNLESVYNEFETNVLDIPEEYNTDEINEVIQSVLDKEESILSLSADLKEDLKELEGTTYPVTEGNIFLDRQLRIENSELYAYCKNFLNTEFKVIES